MEGHQGTPRFRACVKGGHVHKGDQKPQGNHADMDMFMNVTKNLEFLFDQKS